VCRLNPGFEVPSRVTIEEMCDGIFDEARKELLDRLRGAPRRVSLAVGKADQTPEARRVGYIASHLIGDDDQWNLHKFVLHAHVDDAEHDFMNGPILGVHVAVDAIADVECVISETIMKKTSGA
jgi:hypothetical protein